MNSTYYVAFRFITELILAALIYMIPVKRRKGFVWKLPVCILFCLWTSAMSGHFIQDYPALQILRYALLLLLAAGLLRVCFELNGYGALFCAISAYASQHIMIRTFSILERFLISSLWLEAFVYLLYMAACYGLFYHVFARRMKNQDYTRIQKWEMMVVFSALILCSIVLAVMTTQFGQGIGPVMRLVLSCYSSLCCLLILIIQFGIFQKGQLQNEMAVMEYLWKQERKQYRTAKENMDMISMKCHDMKHLIRDIGLRISQEEQQELLRSIDIYDSSVKTGCEVLDIILAEKSLLCSQRKITMTCMADGAKLNFLRQGDLYSVLSNAIDNAIEAVSRLEDVEKRIIGIVVTEQMGNVLIHIENYYEGSLLLDEGMPVTQKTDKNYHGFGMKSIRHIVEKHNGTMVCTGEEGLFRLDMLIPMPALAK